MENNKEAPPTKIQMKWTTASKPFNYKIEIARSVYANVDGFIASCCARLLLGHMDTFWTFVLQHLKYIYIYCLNVCIYTHTRQSVCVYVHKHINRVAVSNFFLLRFIYFFCSFHYLFSLLHFPLFQFKFSFVHYSNTVWFYFTLFLTTIIRQA